MAVSPLQLESGLTGPPLTAGLPSVSALRRIQGRGRDTDGFQALTHLAAIVWCGKCRAFSGVERMPPEERQDQTHWWDNRRSETALQHPDFRDTKATVALWLDNGHKPAWVDSQLAMWDAGMKSPPPESLSTPMQGQEGCDRLASQESHLEVEMCRRLCEDGPVTDAVDALTTLVQRGCHVHYTVVYRVLKRCKDLVLGRRIHALTVKSGYEGDAFLATHLIGMYSSHGRLEEAMRVFTKVSTPSVYNWATIIFAYARHGKAEQAAEAIRLYRQMRVSTTIKPDDRIYVAVLKACAAGGDLVAGKEVHAHILASSGKPNIFVQTGLVDMYAKCGSLEDARRVFDGLPQRDVVMWTAMIAGYAQQGMGQEALSLYNSLQQEGLSPPNSVTYVCLLQACAGVGVGALLQGKQLHAEIQDRGLQHDMALGSSLVNMYAKCGSVEDARRVFDTLSDRDVVTWTAMISGYAQQGLGQEALSLYKSMQQEGLTPPNSVTYACLLQACASEGVGALDQGKQLHAQIEEQGLQDDVVLGGSLINMYAKCGSLEDARSVLDGLADKNGIAWNAMLAGYAQQGMGQEALDLYHSMQQEGFTPDSVTFVCLLQACASVGIRALHQGKQLHAQIEARGLQDDVVLGGSLVNMYANCGRLEDARNMFDRLPARNVVSWTAMIAGYAQQGMGQEALGLYSRMQQEGLTPPGPVTYVCLLQACASVGVGALQQGKQLHAGIEDQGLQDDVVLGGSLVNMYAKCGSVEDARKVFDTLADRNVVTWTTMIAGYAQQGMGQEALSLHNSMQQEGLTPNVVTYACLLQACASEGVEALDQGKRLHAQIEEQGLQNDVVLGGSLVNMYAKCGSVEDARRVFDTLSHRDIVTWTAMIAGYAQQGMGQEALSLYSSMEPEDLTPPDSVAFVSLLQACASVGVGALDQGKRLHAQIEELGLQDDVAVGGSLVNMYAKCGSLEDARSMFDKLPDRNVLAWNAMLAAYSQHGMGQEALSLYSSMQEEGIPTDSVTFVCILQACGIVAALPLGKQLHAQIVERGLQADPIVGAALVNMYAKCGSMVDSQQAFDCVPEKPIEAWGALIGGYSRQGDSEFVFHLVDRMRVEGIQPDGVTFLSVLTVCSHVGLVEEGRKYFEAMRTDYGISPTVEHYTCMIDLLGRAGHLDEALRMVKTMPFAPNGVVWLTLLGACRKWNDVEIGQQACEFAVSVDAKD